MATAQQVLAQLAALAGENESKVGSNNTTVNKYFGAPGAAYCGYSLLYAFAKAGSKLLDGSGAANVGNLARFCEGKGWRVSTPQAGDIFVQRSGGYENGHTGFVWKNLGNGYFITLEGNYGAVKATAAQAENGTGSTFEGIGYRKQKITSDYKFYRPAYDGASSGGSTPAPAPTPTPRTADKAKVKEFQKFLGVAQDADPGPDTEKAALKKMLLGVLTKRPLRQGDTGDEVAVLQGLFYCLGYDPKGLDKSFGSGCAAAVREFEKDEGLTVDAGAAGKEVVTRLLDKVFK